MKRFVNGALPATYASFTPLAFLALIFHFFLAYFGLWNSNNCMGEALELVER